MGEKRALIVFLSLLPMLFNISNACGASSGDERPRWIRAAIDVETSFSGGDYRPETFLRKAREAGIEVVVFSDSLLRKWEFGLFPLLGKIIHKTVEEPSLLSRSPKEYLKLIADLQKSNPDLVLVPGAEVSPHYWWEGNVFQKKLSIRGYHRQLLIFGLPGPEDYKALPVIGNPHIRRYTWKSVFLFWPVGLVWWGIRIFRKKKYRKIVFQGREFLIRSKFYPPFGIAVAIGGIALLIVNFPFKKDLYNPRNGPLGIDPFQRVIDETVGRNGLAFWAHPEASWNERIGPVFVKTEPYPDALMKTNGYTGFCSFYEGYRAAGGVGGTWDRALEEFCLGDRSSPPWTIGELDFHSEEEIGGKPVDEVLTILLAERLDREAVLGSLANGRCYTRWKGKDEELVLESFLLRDERGQEKTLGGTLETSGNVYIRFTVSERSGKNLPLKAAVIRNGEVLKVFKGETPLNIEMEDRLPERKMSYYRLDVEGRYPSRLIANPVFVKREKG